MPKGTRIRCQTVESDGEREVIQDSNNKKGKLVSLGVVGGWADGQNKETSEEKWEADDSFVF